MLSSPESRYELLPLWLRWPLVLDWRERGRRLGTLGARERRLIVPAQQGMQHTEGPRPVSAPRAAHKELTDENCSLPRIRHTSDKSGGLPGSGSQVSQRHRKARPSLLSYPANHQVQAQARPTQQ